jgi:adenosylcobinamide-GDP ribazoletransferase
MSDRDDKDYGEDTGGTERSSPAAILSAWRVATRTVAGTFLRPPLALCGIATPAPEDGALARAARGFPVAGLGLGLAAALVLLIARVLDLPMAVAAALALALSAGATGGLFDAGLARFAQGIAAFAPKDDDNRDAALAAPRERKPGYFGVLMLIVAFAVKLGALAALSGSAAAAALIAAEAAAWGAVPVVLHYLAPAGDRGLAARAGRPTREEASLAAAFGAAVALLFLGPWTGIIALAVGAAAVVKVAWLARRATGGVTGAALGAAQQGAVIGMLIAVAALA